MATPVSQSLGQKNIPLFFVIVLLLGGVGYVAYTRSFMREESHRGEQQTQNSFPTNEEELYDNQLLTEEINTSDWKTYHNEEYGFELKYPGKYFLYDDQVDVPAVAQAGFTIEKYPNKGREGGEFIEVLIFSNPKQEPLLDWLHANGGNTIPAPLDAYRNVVIGGEESIQYISEYSGMYDGIMSIQTLVGGDEQIVYIWAGRFSEADTQLKQEINNVLATFQFIR
jgi:hypothetical protein